MTWNNALLYIEMYYRCVVYSMYHKLLRCDDGTRINVSIGPGKLILWSSKVRKTCLNFVNVFQGDSVLSFRF